jgi:hypothetical protein
MAVSSTYTLGNAEEKNKAHPTTFFIPSWELRDGVTVGTLVKLLFEGVDGRSERMWVKVTEVLSGPQFKGVLDNDALSPHLPKCGSVIEFGPENILSIYDM